MEESAPLRILLVTDAWEPQVNGVVRTLSRTVEECRAMGHEVEVIHPGLGFKTFPLPTYPEIKMAVGARKDLEARFKAFEPEAIHIATEGSLGQAARAICLKWKLPFTTSYHTKFPEYVNARLPFIPISAGYWFMRRFHNSGNRLMVATPSMRDMLTERGFNNITPWARGVDTELFHPDKRHMGGESVYEGLQGPIFVYIGRVAVEKNIESFLDLDLPGTKVIVGPGPQLEELKKKYPEGLVILKSMATGTPVAAYVANGPKDIIPGSKAGSVNDDLKTACLEALEMKREDCRAYAEKYSWRSCAEEFVQNLKPQPRPERRRFWRRLRRLGRRG